MHVRDGQPNKGRILSGTPGQLPTDSTTMKSVFRAVLEDVTTHVPQCSHKTNCTRCRAALAERCHGLVATGHCLSYATHSKRHTAHAVAVTIRMDQIDVCRAVSATLLHGDFCSTGAAWRLCTDWALEACARCFYGLVVYIPYVTNLTILEGLLKHAQDMERIAQEGQERTMWHACPPPRAAQRHSQAGPDIA
jgi:hypothetical protein